MNRAAAGDEGLRLTCNSVKGIQKNAIAMLQQVESSEACQTYSCVNSFPSCQYGGDVYAHYSDGGEPSGGTTGTLSLQSTNPENCQSAIIGSTCPQQYWFSVQDGFIQLIYTSTDSCIAGSAQQSTAFFTKGKCWPSHI